VVSASGFDAGSLSLLFRGSSVEDFLFRFRLGDCWDSNDCDGSEDASSYALGLSRESSPCRSQVFTLKSLKYFGVLFQEAMRHCLVYVKSMFTVVVKRGDLEKFTASDNNRRTENRYS